MNKLNKHLVILLVVLSLTLLFSSCSKKEEGISFGTYVCDVKNASLTINDDSTAEFKVSDEEEITNDCKVWLKSINDDLFLENEDEYLKNSTNIDNLDLSDYINKVVTVRTEDLVEVDGAYYIYFPDLYVFKLDEELEYHLCILFKYYPGTKEMVLDGSVYNEVDSQFVFVKK